MSLIFFSDHGFPGLVDSDCLPCIDGNPCAERLVEIAAALEREGFAGVRVQYAQIGDGRFILTLNLLQNSLGEYVMEFFSDFALKQKKIFSVEAALVIAKEFRKQESGARNERHN